MPPKSPLASLVSGRERFYYALLVFFSLIFYAGLVGVFMIAPPETLVSFVYIPVVAAAFWMTHGLMIGRLRGNGVRVSPRQFPTLYRIAAEHAKTLGIKRLPDVFVLEAGGLLNAFATRFLGRDFVVIYSDVLAMAEMRGEAAVGFIVAHELAHIRRGHLRNRWLTLPGRFVPYLGAAYSRACEYTCDRFGAHC